MAQDWKEKVPLLHYTALFTKLDPCEAAARCNVPFNAVSASFPLRFMGNDYLVHHPDFNLEGPPASVSERILMLRYLCEGCWTPFRGKALSYREIPWGEVYFKNFEGRCLRRFARSFGEKPEVFIQIMEQHKELYAEKIAQNHPAYRFEFFSNLFISFLLWPGDDEFPASAQIIFDDNVSAAFSAEDIVIATESVISRLVALGGAL